MKKFKILLVFALVITFANPSMFNAASRTFDHDRDYLTYTEGNGEVTLTFTDTLINLTDYTFEDVALYKINGNSSDINSNETDDEKISVLSTTDNTITWQVPEDAYYYVTIDNKDSRSAFGTDLVTCYLWLNTNENAYMILDFDSIPGLNS